MLEDVILTTYNVILKVKCQHFSKNDDFISKNDDFISKNYNFIRKNNSF